MQLVALCWVLNVLISSLLVMEFSWSEVLFLKLNLF